MGQKFVVYEVWPRARVVDAESEQQAYEANEPLSPPSDLSLCNWYVVSIPTSERLQLKAVK